MCSNADRSGPLTRPKADLATRLAAAIDELAAAASSRGDAVQDGTDQDSTDQDGTGERSTGEHSTGEDTAGQDAAGQDMAERLARAWAMITAADPEMAARTARYSRP